MSKLNFVLSLAMQDNDYQQEQASAAKKAAERLGISLEVLYAGNDAINQSQQLLKTIQSSHTRPNAILCLPVGTPMMQVAREAVAAGIGWAILNRDPDYITELRNTYDAPACSVTVDQEEVGRIQGLQFGALLPEGGLVLYILGPSVNPGVPLRMAGMESTKPKNIEVRTLRGNWTEKSGYDAIATWVGLSTSRAMPVRLIAAQNDNMAIGARKALADKMKGEERERWARLPHTGCDAGRETGQEWIRRGLLSASILLPPTAGVAVELLAKAIAGKSQPTARTLLAPVSFPPIEKLVQVRPIKSSAQPALSFAKPAHITPR